MALKFLFLALPSVAAFGSDATIFKAYSGEITGQDMSKTLMGFTQAPTAITGKLNMEDWDPLADDGWLKAKPVSGSIGVNVEEGFIIAFSRLEGDIGMTNGEVHKWNFDETRMNVESVERYITASMPTDQLISADAIPQPSPANEDLRPKVQAWLDTFVDSRGTDFADLIALQAPDIKMTFNYMEAPLDLNDPKVLASILPPDKAKGDPGFMAQSGNQVLATFHPSTGPLPWEGMQFEFGEDGKIKVIHNFQPPLPPGFAPGPPPPGA